MQDVLIEMKDPDWDYGTEKQLKQRIKNFVPRLGVEIIIIDECQHLGKGTKSDDDNAGIVFSDVTDALMRVWISADNATAWTRRIQVIPEDLKRFDDVAFNPEGYAPLRFSETTNITGARQILNLEGMPNCDLRKLFADDIASRPQFGSEKAVGLGVVLEEAQRSISVAEICERNRWSPRRLKGQVLKFTDARTATGWKREVIEGSGLLIS